MTIRASATVTAAAAGPTAPHQPHSTRSALISHVTRSAYTRAICNCRTTPCHRHRRRTTTNALHADRRGAVAVTASSAHTNAAASGSTSGASASAGATSESNPLLAAPSSGALPCRSSHASPPPTSARAVQLFRAHESHLQQSMASGSASVRLGCVLNRRAFELPIHAHWNLSVLFRPSIVMQPIVFQSPAPSAAAAVQSRSTCLPVPVKWRTNSAPRLAAGDMRGGARDRHLDRWTAPPAAHAAGSASGDDDSMVECCSGCDRFVSSAFGWIGWKAATYPLAFLGFSMFVATLCCLGYFGFHAEADPALRYTPYNSDLPAQTAAVAASGFVHAHERVTHVLLRHPTLDESDVLTPAHLHALFDVRDRILSTAIIVGGTRYALGDLCVRGAALGARGRANVNSPLASECALQGPTDFWSNSRAALLADSNIYTTLFGPSATATDAIGSPVRVWDVVSSRTFASPTTLGAAGFQFTLRLLNRPTAGGGPTDVTEPPEDELAAAWEAKLRSNLAALTYTPYPSNAQAAQSSGVQYSSDFDGFRLWVLSPELVLSSQRDALSHDQPLLVASYFLVWLYLIVAYYRRNYVRSRMGMSIVSVATVALAMASGVGACAGLGLPFHSDMILLSFFLLAVGLGDSFILMACIQPLEPSWRQTTPFALHGLASKVRSRFWWIRAAESEGVLPINRAGQRAREDDREDADGSGDADSESIEGAVSVGVAAAGPFVTVLNIALSTSLVIGAYTSIPAFRCFCITACVCVAFLWVFHFTFFLPCLALDAQRQNARRCDAPWCCCPPVAPYALEHKLCTANEPFDESDSSVCGSWFGSRCLAGVMHPVGHFLTLVAFVGLLAASIYGCTLVTTRVADVATLEVPRGGGEVARALDARDDLFLLSNRVQPLVHIYSVVEDVDYFNSHSLIMSGSVRYWWTSYLSFLASTAPYNAAGSSLVSGGKPVSSTIFASSLLEFLNTPSGAQYWLDLIPINAGLSSSAGGPDLGGGLRAMRVSFRLQNVEDSTDAGEAMESLRDVTAASQSTSMPLFPMHADYGALETQRALASEVLQHLLICGATIFLALLFLLANLWAAVLVLLAIGVMAVHMTGLLALAGHALSPHSAMPTLVWLGLSLGFFLHSMHAYLRCMGTRAYRARKTMQKIGGTVIDFIVVLLFSVVLLSAAHTRALYADFVSLALLAGLGAFHGLAVWPVLLAYVGPVQNFSSEIVLADVESNRVAHFNGARGNSSAGVQRDPANPFGEEFDPPPRTATGSMADSRGFGVEMQERESSASRSHHAYSAHAPASTAQTSGQQLQNRGTPQKLQQQQPERTNSWM